MNRIVQGLRSNPLLGCWPRYPPSSSASTLFVAPVLVLLSLFIAPTPMDLQFWPGAVIMVMLATLTVLFVANTGRSAWYVGVMLLVVYVTFAMTLYLLPPTGPVVT